MHNSFLYQIAHILYFPIPHNALRLGGQAEIQNGWLVRTIDGTMGKNDFCCAPNCSNRRNRKENIQLYRIPKDKELRKIWLLRIRRKQFKPTANTRLCSEHFVGGRRSMDPSSASYFPSVIFHSHNKSNGGRNTLRSRSTIPNDQEGDHKPKVERKLKMVGAFYYNVLFREGLILFKIAYNLYTLAKKKNWELCEMPTTNNNDFSLYLCRN